MNALKASIASFFCLATAVGYSQTLSSRFTIKPNGDIAKTVMKVNSDQITVKDIALTSPPPKIVYDSPQNYIINQPIPVLTPVNTGGTIPPSAYGTLDIASYGFSTVTGVAVDADGNVFIADWNLNQIKKLTPTGVLSVFAGSAYGASGSTDGLGTAATFYEPDALVLDDAGNLYVSDQGNHKIRKISPSGMVSTLAGNGASGLVDGTGSNASFNNPRGLALDGAGNLYVADQVNNAIRKITPDGVVATFAGSQASGFTNGPRQSARFNTPTAVAVDAGQNIYISDASNGAVRKITPDGMVSTLATGLSFPRELRADATGNIYVAEQNGYSIKRISPNGSVSTVVPYGLTGPIGLTLDGKGYMYLGDIGIVRRVTISGFTIDKQLPPGLTFNSATGAITGTPTTTWPPTDYKVTAFNSGGSSETIVNIAVYTTSTKRPSVITLPPQRGGDLEADNNYDPKGTSTNNRTPIVYTSSDPTIAYPIENGLIHVLRPGVITLTANQQGDDRFEDAAPAQMILTFKEYLRVLLPQPESKTICDAPFQVGALRSNAVVPLEYRSSNPSVATISNDGIVTVKTIGTTTITISQHGDPSLYIDAAPDSKVLTVKLQEPPKVRIEAKYDSQCAGSSVTFNAISENAGSNVSYDWVVNGKSTGNKTADFSSAVLKDGDIVSCSCINNDNTCVAGFPGNSNDIKLSFIAPVQPSVTIQADKNGVFPETPITFTATVENASSRVKYQWKVNGDNVGANSQVFTSSSLNNKDHVTCEVTPLAVCGNIAVSEAIEVKIVVKVEIPNTFTPNGDGINDFWNITGIASFPACTVRIFNRNGMLVFESKGYQQAWDGTSNGSPLPLSTYYYVIDLASENRTMSGSITIIR
ncbi:T9SS type B sorting domain-containing protein [Pedobacter sp. HMF7647]|uniref:T9SS type B sorting domain-containing protein n=1 Tax=Hufsiella arboris TaxID=2695275 RepID=A0A7K1YBS0_9SPHI|nr:gliding motility-associated C-terminal domain-containing protein [Hufsiella arboris]MXV52036.1 T9SS type B sorting domain-containing protein [Hufsiella arboris]